MKKTLLYTVYCSIITLSFLLVRCNSSSNSGTNSTTVSLPGTWSISSIKCKQIPVNHQSGTLCWKSVVNAMGTVNTSNYFVGYATFTQPNTLQLVISTSNNTIFSLLDCLGGTATSVSASGSYQSVGTDSLFITLSQYNGAAVNPKYSTFLSTYSISGNTMTIELYLAYSEQWELIFTKSA